MCLALRGWAGILATAMPRGDVVGVARFVDHENRLCCEVIAHVNQTVAVGSAERCVPAVYGALDKWCVADSRGSIPGCLFCSGWYHAQGR